MRVRIYRFWRECRKSSRSLLKSEADSISPLRKERAQRVPSLSVFCVFLLPVCFTSNFPFYFVNFILKLQVGQEPSDRSSISFEGCDKSQIDISCFLSFSSLLFKRFIESVERPRFRRDDPQRLDQSEILYDSYSFESVHFHFLRNVSIVQIFIFQLLMLQVLRYTLLNFHFLLYLSFANCN